MIVLRPHQERAINDVRAAFRRVKRVCLVMPTGAGKTATASTLIAWAVGRGRRVLFLVHRREIVADTHRRLVAAGVDCGLVMAGAPASPLLKVQVASVQTIAARGERPAADLLVWDECHHVAATTYREIAAKYPNTWHLGLTATPERSDGQGLRDAFDEMVVGATVAELQAAVDPSTGFPYLAGLDVIAPPGRQESGALAEEPVAAWRKHGAPRATVAFCRSVAESRALAARFEAEGIAARHVDGEMPVATRVAALDAFARGDVTVLTNVFVLTEGWDCPRAKVVLLARGCGSAATFLQMVGRGLRAFNGERCTLIDLGGVVHEHGMPDEERDYTLDGIRRRPKKKRPWLRQCSSCGFVVLGVKSGRRCSRCDAAWPQQAPSEVSKVGVVRVTKLQLPSRAELRATYEELLREADERGYRPGWAGYKFKDKFGFWPRGFAT